MAFCVSKDDALMLCPRTAKEKLSNTPNSNTSHTTAQKTIMQI